MQQITTNECFHHLCILLKIHKDKELIIKLFESQNVEISKAKIDSWRAKDPNADKYREMPRQALDDFIVALYEQELGTVSRGRSKSEPMKIIKQMCGQCERCAYDYLHGVNELHQLVRAETNEKENIMQVKIMKEIKNSRENLVGFLNYSDILKINELLNENIDKLSFYQTCDLVIEQYKSKQIKNKVASEIFEILMNENTSLKTNRYRYYQGSLFVFSEKRHAYLYESRITKKEFNMQSLGTIYI